MSATACNNAFLRAIVLLLERVFLQRFSLRHLLLVPALLFLSAYSLSALAQLAVGRSDAQIMVNGKQQSYRLYTPSTINNPGATFPLIIALHGDGGSGPSFENELGMDAVADANGGAIIAYPSASGGSWNRNNQAGIEGDAAFIDAVVSTLVNTGKVKPGAVFVTGSSGGASMIVQMFAHNATKTAWKAIAAHSSSGMWKLSGNDGSYPRRVQIAALQTHGLQDNSGGASYANGAYARDDYWVKGNGCTAVKETVTSGTTNLSGILPAWDAGTPYCLSYQGCAKPEIWCPIPGMGHALWNQAAQVSWKFFAQQMDSTPVVPNYSATITPTSNTFPAATVGYGPQTARQFTITNTGTGTINNLTAALSNTTAFEISTALSRTSLTPNQTATVSVRPKTGLAASTYTGTLTITGSNGISIPVALSFTVNPAPTYSATITPISNTFAAATAGYGSQTAQQFTITNNGTVQITNLAAALSNTTAFEISTNLSRTSLNADQTATVSVRPKTGLAASTYTGTLTITGSNGISLTPVTLSFTVNALPVITISSHPASTTVTQGSISGNLSVTASVTQSATLSYQWYRNTTNSNTGGTQVGTSANFAIPTNLTAGTYYYYCVVSATGGATSVRSNVATVTVSAAPVAPSITSANNTTVTSGTASSFTVTASGTTPISYSLTGAVPNGVSINSASGAISIAATTAAGEYAFIITADNGSTPYAQSFTLKVSDPLASPVPPAITSANNAMVINGTDSTFQVTAGGAPPISYSLSGQPAGVSIDSATGLMTIAATTAAGSHTFAITATDSTSLSNTISFTLIVGSAKSDYIQKAYIAFFNRPADVPGMEYWMSYPGDAQDILTEFSKSAEYLSDYAGLPNRLIISKVYKNLFGRAPETKGLNYWSQQMDAGWVSIANVAYEILGGAQNEDAIIIENKVKAANMFTGALNTWQKADAYNEAGPNGLADVAKTWLAGVNEDEASVDAASAGVNAVLKELVDRHWQ